MAMAIPWQSLVVGGIAIVIACTLHLRKHNNDTRNMSEQLIPVVFCGPSGVGKGTLIEMLMKRFPNDQFGFSVSHTTRKPRDGEVDGKHYHFTTVEEIKKEIDAGKFVEYAEVRVDMLCFLLLDTHIVAHYQRNQCACVRPKGSWELLWNQYRGGGISTKRRKSMYS